MMEATRPVSRVLAALELLQDRPGISGPALAQELGITTRTVRRYITTLQEMGIPVEPAAGRTGGYWLRPGYRLPPLMFSAEEAIGLAVALLSTRTSSATDLPIPVVSALKKIGRVLPKELADRVAAVRDSMNVPDSPYSPLDAFPNPAVLATLAQATLAHQRCWLRYSRPDGDESAREVDPYGIVVLSGRWYLHGWCYLRKGTRTFRVDRIRRVDLLPDQFEPPADFDVTQAVMRSVASVFDGHDVELEIAAPLDAVRMHLPPQVAVLEAIDNRRTRLTASTNNLQWFAWRLIELPFPMTVIKPDELREVYQELGRRLLAIGSGERATLRLDDQPAARPALNSAASSASNASAGS